MTKYNVLGMVSAIAILALPLSAFAFDTSVGGVGVSGGSTAGGGTSATAGTGDSSTTVSIGSGNTVAGVGATPGADTAGVGGGSTDTLNASILSAGQQPGLAVGQDPDSTDAALTLGLAAAGADGTADDTAATFGDTIGGLLDGVNVGAIPGLPDEGFINPDIVAAGFDELSNNDKMLVMNRCAKILLNPTAFHTDVIALCRKIARL